MKSLTRNAYYKILFVESEFGVCQDTYNTVFITRH